MDQNLRTAKERRRAWRAATRAAEGIHSEEWTEEVQRRSNDETSCWSKDLLKTRIFLKEDVSEEAEMFAQQGMRQNSDEQDAPVQKKKPQKMKQHRRQQRHTECTQRTQQPQQQQPWKQEQRPLHSNCKVTGSKPTSVAPLARAISVIAERASLMVSLRGDGDIASEESDRELDRLSPSNVLGQCDSRRDVLCPLHVVHLFSRGHTNSARANASVVLWRKSWFANSRMECMGFSYDCDVLDLVYIYVISVAAEGLYAHCSFSCRGAFIWTSFDKMNFSFGWQA